MKEQLSRKQKGPPSLRGQRRKKKGGRERERDGLLKSRVHLPRSFCFFLLVCFFSSPPHLQHPPPLISSPHLQHTFALPSFNFSPPPSSSSTHPPTLHRLPPSSLFSSLCLPREKRFCLLLVSAPSQSAFLISSYCFCLIFKCYPGPNGNPYKKKKEKKRRGVRERERERGRNRLGIGFPPRTLRQKPPPPPPPRPPQGKIWKVFWGGGGVEG